MKKTYIYYSQKLLVGLLSLQTLSACGNMRGKLGMGGPLSTALGNTTTVPQNYTTGFSTGSLISPIILSPNNIHYLSGDHALSLSNYEQLFNASLNNPSWFSPFMLR